MMRNLAHAEPALYTSLTVVDLTIEHGQSIDEPASLVPHLHATSDRAVRAGRLDEIIRFALPFTGFFSECAGRTDRNTRAAEFASGLDMVPAERGTHNCFRTAIVERQHPGSAHFLAHPHASTAQNADVVVAVVKRVHPLGFVVPVKDGIVDVGDFETLDQVLEFALTVVRAVPASGGHARFPNRAHELPAFLAFIADKAARRMLA